jgi:ankyrin repeat protein
VPAVKFRRGVRRQSRYPRRDGYTALHHAAPGDNDLVLYLVGKGADVKAKSRKGQTTADMANGPIERVSPFPETIELLVKLGAKNNNKCVSC